MAYNKAERSDSPMKRRGGMRRRKKVCVFCGKDNTIDYKDTFPKEEKSFPEESPETVQSIREHLLLLSSAQDILHLCLT